MSSELSWFKSSYSDDQGSACLEVAHSWRRSSYSDSSGSACLEAAASPNATRIRDSKLGARSPQLVMPAYAWAAFVGHARGV
jgi:hypothetical protein